MISYWDIRKGLCFRARGSGSHIYEVARVTGKYAWLFHKKPKQKGFIQVLRKKVPEYIEKVIL